MCTQGCTYTRCLEVGGCYSTCQEAAKPLELAHHNTEATPYMQPLSKLLQEDGSSTSYFPQWRSDGLETGRDVLVRSMGSAARAISTDAQA